MNLEQSLQAITDSAEDYEAFAFVAVRAEGLTMRVCCGDNHLMQLALIGAIVKLLDEAKDMSTEEAAVPRS